jgi:hypothetical protein
MNEKEARLSIQELIDELLKYPEGDREAIMSEVLGPVECVPIYAAVMPTMGTEPDTPAPIDVISTIEYLNMLRMKPENKDIITMIYKLKLHLRKIGDTFTLVDALEISKKIFERGGIPTQYDNFLTTLFGFEYQIKNLDIDYGENNE